MIARPVHPPPPPPERVLREAERLYNVHETERTRGHAVYVIIEWGALTDDERRPWLAVAARAIADLAPPGGRGEKPIEVCLGTWKRQDGAWCSVRLVVPRRRVADLAGRALKSKHSRAEIAGGSIVLLAERAAAPAEPTLTPGSVTAEIHAGAGR